MVNTEIILVILFEAGYEIKRHLLLGSKAMINLDSILKSRDITLSTKVRLVKAMVSSVVMYGRESWTILQESATYGEHIWFETNVSGDFCYVGEQYCVAKMLVSERGAARRPLVVEPGLEPCRQALPGEGGNGALA